MRGHSKLFSLIILYPFFAFSQAENFLEQGQVALREERYTDAINYFTEMIKLNKKDCHAHVLRARAYKSTEQIHEALNDLNAAFALPCSKKLLEEILYLRGIIHLNNGDLDMAKNDFEMLLQIYPEYKDASYYAGIMYYRMGAYDASLMYINKFLSLKGNHPEACYYKGLCFYQQKKFEEAIESLSVALPHKSQNMQLLMKLYECYIKTNQLKQALDMLSSAIEVAPKNKLSELYLERSMLHAQLGNLEKSYQDKIQSQQLALASH